MTIRVLLIVVQLLVLPIWPGLCTCSRATRTETRAATCDCGCCGGCCSPERQHPAVPKPPCDAPSCPAEVSLVRADPVVPTIPVAVPAPAALTIDRTASANPLPRTGRFDSTNSVPTHIFLACSVLLI